MNKAALFSVYQHPLIGYDDFQKIISAHRAFKFSKGAVLLKAGQVANNYHLIEEGLTRAYVHDFDGREITTEFYAPNEFSIEVSSLFQRLPTQETIVAVTDGTAWEMKFDTFQELFHRIEGFREWGRSWSAQQLFNAKQRSIDIITKTATERYLAVLEERPEIIQYAPVKYIASYLGITDTSLSRIRKEM